MLSLAPLSSARRLASRFLVLAFPAILAAVVLVAMSPTLAGGGPPGPGTPPGNAAPVIEDFTVVQAVPSAYTFSGRVLDANDPVQGFVVTFGGVVDGYGVTATVGADGYFETTAVLVGLHSGFATAQTRDPHGALSNTALYYVLVNP